MSNNVSHPSHYNAHPAGIECIDVIRHYTCDIANAIKYLWRAGLKPEQGMDDAEKEIEDLKKALFYIEDYRKNMPKTEIIQIPYGKQFFKETTGYELDDVIAPYNEYVSWAIHCLCYLGIVRGGRVFAIEKCNTYIDNAKEAIRQRILAIETEAISKDCADIRQYIGKLIVLSYGDFVSRLAFVKGICHFNDSAEYVDFYFVAESSSMKSRMDSGFTFRPATDLDINRTVIDRCKGVAESDGYKF